MVQKTFDAGDNNWRVSAIPRIIPNARQANTFAANVPKGKLWLYMVPTHLEIENLSTLPKPPPKNTKSAIFTLYDSSLIRKLSNNEFGMKKIQTVIQWIQKLWLPRLPALLFHWHQGLIPAQLLSV